MKEGFRGLHWSPSGPRRSGPSSFKPVECGPWSWKSGPTSTYSTLQIHKPFTSLCIINSFRMVPRRTTLNRTVAVTFCQARDSRHVPCEEIGRAIDSYILIFLDLCVYPGGWGADGCPITCHFLTDASSDVPCIITSFLLALKLFYFLNLFIIVDIILKNS